MSCPPSPPFDAELDRQFSPSQWSHGVAAGLSPAAVVDAHCSALLAGSQRARDMLASRRVSFGATTEQVVEWFGPAPATKADTVLVYIHGGFWQLLDLASSAFMAPAMAKHGVATAAVGYDLCPAVSMETLVGQVEAGVRCVLEQASASAAVFVAGHSAGAHLAAELMIRLCPDPRIRALFLISGVYDLQPLISTSVNTALGMDAASSRRLSPQHATRIADGWPATRVLVACGEHDSPAFIAQSEAFADRLRRQPGLDVHLRRESGEDHFTMIECLADEGHPFTQLLLEWMRPAVEAGGD